MPRPWRSSGGSGEAAGELDIAVRRDTGWYGQALRERRARIRVPGLEADVTIEDIGDAPVTAPSTGRARAPW
ncbi:DUF2255 family protein [Amycolatopsis saalfeldensis]|uniref:DUF2255 family protein n=1 Tax=Amycolatopsis saalfeldensis TaxID=394193 RepID=UPI0015A575B0|nr:hypothetical protein [Amycolatopsis saalfeldensis]